MKQQNTLLSETKAMLEEEVGSLHQKLDGLGKKSCSLLMCLILFLVFVGELQAENAAMKVRVSSLDQELSDESQRMQDLLQENAQLELESDRL